MIPGKIARFVQERANTAGMASRDADLVPHVHRVSGWRLGKDGKTITAYLPALFAEHLLEAMENNGQVAFSLEEYPAHETYQFKGVFVRQRALEAEDRALVATQRERFVRDILPLYPEAPVDLIRGYVVEPDVAVEFEVQEIYLQTPGPGAGARLVPPAER